MGSSGFFVLRLDEPGQQPAAQGERSTSRRALSAEAAREGAYHLKLEWIDGVPHITDLGSAAEIRVNATPIEPHLPVSLQVGDRVTIANLHLTWQEQAEVEQPIQLRVSARGEAVLESPPVDSRPAPVFSAQILTPQWAREITLTGKRLRIGRAPDNDIHIDDEHISRYHAQLVQHAQGYEIVDLGSVNGLRYHNTRIDRKVLADGDVIWLSKSISLAYRVTQPSVEDLTVVREGAEPEPVDETLPPKKEAEPPRVEGVDVTIAAPRPDGLAPQPKFAAGQPSEPAPEPAADMTVVVPRRIAQAPESGAGEEDTTFPATPSKDLARDETIVVPQLDAGPKKPVPTEAVVPPPSQTDDMTLVAAREAVTPPKPGTPSEDLAADRTVVVPKPSVGTPEVPPVDKTVVAKKKIPESPAIEAGDRQQADAARETEWVDMAQYLGGDTVVAAAVISTIVRDTQVPHMVIHLPDRTWEVQFTRERMIIGRDLDSDIPIPDESISRHHAYIERRGDDFVIRETQSKNGIWLGPRRVEEHTLRNGDVISAGRAKLIFKAGFTSDDLTLIGMPHVDGRPARRPVVFVPGLLGSELWLGSERLWPNPKYIISNPEIYRLPGDPRIEARHIVSDVVIVPNIIKHQQYSRLGDYLEAGLGYRRGKDLLEFAYDWRQDVRLAAQRLAETIERWQVDAPITIIAHSLGTLVTRYYVEKLGGKRLVERIILMGGPHYGTPKGLASILIGPGILPFGMGDERMREVLASFPSAYQILPIYRCIVDQDGKYIDPLHDETWLPERQRPFLRAARSFRRELGYRSSVPSVSIFGYGLKTILRLKIHRRHDGQWEKVDFIEDIAGDLTVPSGSAVLKKSEIHPVFQEHGSLYVDDDVKMRLKVELTRSTTGQKGK